MFETSATADRAVLLVGCRFLTIIPKPIGSMYAIYGHIYHQYIPNVSIYIYIPYMWTSFWFTQTRTRGCGTAARRPCPVASNRSSYIPYMDPMGKSDAEFRCETRIWSFAVHLLGVHRTGDAGIDPGILRIGWFLWVISRFFQWDNYGESTINHT